MRQSFYTLMIIIFLLLKALCRCRRWFCLEQTQRLLLKHAMRNRQCSDTPLEERRKCVYIVEA